MAAIMRAREIEERLFHFRTSGVGHKSLGHQTLAKKYVEHLVARVNAGEISPKTKQRYESALQHFLSFIAQHEIERLYPIVTKIDQQFVLLFRASLSQCQVSPNGHPNSRKQVLQSVSYVLSVVRGMFKWAANHDEGQLLPCGFQNPFQNLKSRDERRTRDLFGEPDITIQMATEFLEQCDPFQLRLFAPMLLFGLRASEPCTILRDDVDSEWFKVIGRPEIGYDTKGLRDKRFPVTPALHQLLFSDLDASGCLLYSRRNFTSKNPEVISSEDLINAFEKSCQQERASTKGEQELIRLQLMTSLGGINYDQIDREFRKIAKQLNWPLSATLKDFRHLFSTALENAGVPLFYRRYFMGQSPGRSAITVYTHLNELREQYQRAASTQLASLYTVLEARSPARPR